MHACLWTVCSSFLPCVLNPGLNAGAAAGVPPAHTRLFCPLMPFNSLVSHLKTTEMKCFKNIPCSSSTGSLIRSHSYIIQFSCLFNYAVLTLLLNMSSFLTFVILKLFGFQLVLKENKQKLTDVL